MNIMTGSVTTPAMKQRAEEAVVAMWDDGLCAGRDNLAADARLLRAHSGDAGGGLRFHRFRPTASVGRLQMIEREIRLPHCAEAGIEVLRRQTGGGALYLDPGFQCLSLVVPSARLGATVAERLATGATAIAAGLARLGVDCRFKAPNDLEAEGRRKIGSVFLQEADGTALVFATIPVTLDIAAAMKALLVPTEKLTVTGLEHARERMASLSELLGAAPDERELRAALAAGISEVLGVGTVETKAPNAPSGETAEPLVDARDAEVISGAVGEKDAPAGTFETKDKIPGATLRLVLTLGEEDRAVTVRFATDAHVAPASLLGRLGEALVGVPVTGLAAAARTWLDGRDFDAAGLEPAAIIRLIERAAEKHRLNRELGLTHEQLSGMMLAGDGGNAIEALEKANVMLVPYCAKPNWCKWRHTIDCVECGLCEVGDAYRMARERNMEVVTITNFEHLSDTLDTMKSAGVESYVGMCCGDFFLKRHHAFRDSGMDAVLLDIVGATCYELNEEHLAYAGAFKAEAKLDADALDRLMQKVPAQAVRPCISGQLSRPGEKKYERAAQGCGNCGCHAAPKDVK